MKLTLVLAVVAAMGFAYLYWLRPYLKTLPAFAEAWRSEDTAWQAVKVWLDGRKTLLVGIWGEIVGLFPDFLQIVAGVDLKTALSLPDNWALIVSGIAVPVLMAIFRTKAKGEG